MWKIDYKESQAQKNWCISTVVLEKTLKSPLDWKEIQLKEISPEYSLERLMLKLKLSFRIWNSSTGIQSPPLALFVVVLFKAHLTSHSRMSGSRWVITPLWLSGSWRSFLYSSSVYSCHLFLASASVRSIPFLSFVEPIFAWNVPLVSLIFLKISLVFPILLFSSISLHWSLRKAFLSLLAIPWKSAFKWEYLSYFPLFFVSLLFTGICKDFSDNHFVFLHFFSMRMILIPVSCA